MLILVAVVHAVYYCVLAWTYTYAIYQRTSPTGPIQSYGLDLNDSVTPSLPPAGDPTSASSGSWSWLGALFSPLGDSLIAVVDRTPPTTFAARPASFGRRITDEEGALVGYLIPVSAFADSPSEGYACAGTTVKPGYSVPEPSESWIALVQRGGCGFASKIFTAQSFGARAVVVGNYEPGPDERDGLVQMYAPGSSGANVTIPSAFVTYLSYLRLEKLLETSNTTTSGYRTLSLAMLPEIGGWEWYSPVLTFLALLLLPSLLTLLTLLLHRVRVARARRADRAPEEVVFGLPWRVWGERGLLGDGEGDEGVEKPAQTPPRPPTENEAAREELAATLHSPVPASTASGPTTERTPASSPTEATPLVSGPSRPRDYFTRAGPPPAWFASQTQCAICLGDFERGDRVRILPCRHVFHLEEVDAWLISRKKVCPICKADVTMHLKRVDDPASETGWRAWRTRLVAYLPPLPALPTWRRAAGNVDVERGEGEVPGGGEYGGVGTSSGPRGVEAEEDRWLSISERLARREAREAGRDVQQDQQEREEDARRRDENEPAEHRHDHGDQAREHSRSRSRSPARDASPARSSGHRAEA